MKFQSRLNAVKSYFSFQEKIGRKSFLKRAILGTFLSVLIGLFFSFWLHILSFILIVWFFVAFYVKRINDAGYSVYLVIPLVLSNAMQIFSLATDGKSSQCATGGGLGAYCIAFIIFSLLSFIVFLVLLFTKSKELPSS